MSSEFDKKKREYIVYFLAITIIIAWCLLNIGNLNGIVLMNDEFGYWSHAVSAVGYDWKDLIAETPYYSWGYSIWLVPIIIFSPSSELWYKAAIALNALFLIGAYFLCLGCGKRIFPNTSKIWIGIVGVIVIIYPGNIAYAQVTWSETLLYLLMWLEMYLIVRLEEKFSVKLYITAIVTLVYTYIVHARSIGMIIAGIVSLILILLRHKKKLSHALLLFGLVVLGYLGIDLMKGHLLQTLWDNSQLSDINNVGVNLATISRYVSRFTHQLNWIFSSLGGKYIYLLIATGLTLPGTLVQVFTEYVHNFRERDFWAEHNISKCYCVLALLLSWGVCAVQMNIWTGRKDLIVYGRYMENALGPTLMLGIIYMIDRGRKARTGLLIAGISILLGFVPVYRCVAEAEGQFSTICSPVIGAFCDMAGDETRAFLLLGVVVSGIMVIMYASTFFRKVSVRGKVILISLALMFLITGYYGSKHLIWGRNYYDGMTIPLKERIITDYADREIYFVKNESIDPSSTKPKYLQFVIPGKSIHVVLLEEIGQILGSNVLIMINPEDTEAARVLEESGMAKKVAASGLLEIFAAE